MFSIRAYEQLCREVAGLLSRVDQRRTCEEILDGHATGFYAWGGRGDASSIDRFRHWWTGIGCRRDENKRRKLGSRASEASDKDRQQRPISDQGFLRISLACR